MIAKEPHCRLLTRDRLSFTSGAPRRQAEYPPNTKENDEQECIDLIP
jgi:hypothetical protein